jgi:hypothetical protein
MRIKSGVCGAIVTGLQEGDNCEEKFACIGNNIFDRYHIGANHELCKFDHHFSKGYSGFFYWIGYRCDIVWGLYAKIQRD